MASRDIQIRIIGDATKAQKAFDEAGRSAGTFEGKIDGLGGKFGTFAGTMAGVVTGGALAALPGLLMDGAKGAAEDEAAMLRLKTAVENTGKSYDSQSGAIEEAIKRGQDLAFTDGETAEALANLTAMTGDSDEALRRLGAAQDLARGAGISLEQAAKLLGKTSDENTTALSRLGIQVGENATAQDVLNAVDQKYKGQAGTFAESDAGKMLKSQQAMAELAETAGSLLLPVLGLAASATLLFADGMSTLLGYLEPVTTLIANNLAPILIAVAPVLALIGGAILTTLVPAFIAWTAATLTQLAATLGLNAAMLPMIAVFVAIGVAVAALYLAWSTNFLGIQDITRSVIDWLMPYITAAMDGVKVAFDAALKFIVDLWNTVFPAIQAVVETVFPVIATIVTTYITILKTEIEIGLAIVRTVFETVFPIIRSIVETVFPVIATIVTTAIGTVQTVVETGIAAVKWAFDNVLVPIQSVVSDVFNTIKGTVETVWNGAVDVIKTGIDTAKMAFDGLVYIQGIVEDIFNTIIGFVNSLWLGAAGAVGLISAGLGQIKGLFSGIYDTMYGFGADLLQGLIDGVSSLWDTLKGWMDKIGDIMKIDVPGLSPPYHAGFEQGQMFMTGLADGISWGAGFVQAGIDKYAAAPLAGVAPSYYDPTHPWYGGGPHPGPNPGPNPGPGAPTAPPSGYMPNPQGGGGTNYGMGGGVPTHPSQLTTRTSFNAQQALGVGGLVTANDVKQAIKQGVKEALSGVN